jgi:hypothetical protein
VLALDGVGHLDIPHARGIGRGVRTRMIGVAAEDDRLALSRSGSLEIGNCVLRARGHGRGAKECQRQDKTSHRFSPGLRRSIDAAFVVTTLFDARVCAAQAPTIIASPAAQHGRSDRSSHGLAIPFSARCQGRNLDGTDRIRGAGDPVALGLAASLARPGDDVTSVSFCAGVLGAKRLELLRQLLPKADNNRDRLKVSRSPILPSSMSAGGYSAKIFGSYA